MDASPDAVGEEKIMDAPLATSSSSHRSCKDFQPHHPPPPFLSNVDRHNWTKKYEETGHGFPRGAKVTVSFSLSSTLSSALHHIVFRFFRFHPGYSVRCKNDSPPTIAHTGGFLNILNIMSPCLPIYQKLLRPAGSLLRALSEGPPHLANLKHSLPGSRLLIDKGRSDAKNVLKLGSLILSLWTTTLCVKGRSAPGEVNLSLSDGDYYRVIIRRFCAAL